MKIQEIERLIKTKGIERIELSYRPFVEKKVVRDLVKRLSKSGKEIDIVLSEPTYIFPEKWHEVKRELLSIFESGFGVHLDIEPHILPDFKEEKERYLKLFINFLKMVSWCAKRYGKSVSVAVSVKHYNSVIKDIFKNSDLVVYMIYGVKNVNKVVRVVDEYKNRQIAIALRANDFLDREELFRFMEKISKLSGVNVFIIQNLRQWKELK